MKKLRIQADQVQQIKMYSENSTFISSYDRIENTKEFQLLFEDTKDPICSICGTKVSDFGLCHKKCIDSGYETISEDELFDITIEIFNDIDNSEQNPIRNIVEINGEKFIKRI